MKLELRTHTTGRDSKPEISKNIETRRGSLLTKAVYIASLLLMLPGAASAIVMYDAGTLAFESTAQSMWATGAAFRKEDSVFLGAQWTDKTATIGGILGSENDIIIPEVQPIQLTPYIPAFTTPTIPATYTPGVPAVTEQVWEPRIGTELTGYIGCGCYKTVTIVPAIDPIQLTPEIPGFTTPAVPATYTPYIPPVYADTRTGAQLDITSSGKVGLEFGYTIDSGSVDSAVDFSALAELPDQVNALEFVDLNTSGVFNGGKIDTQSPKIEAHINAIMQLSGSIEAQACALTFGCATGSANLPTVDMNQSILSVDVNSLKILDGVLPSNDPNTPDQGRPLAEIPILNQSLTLLGGLTYVPPAEPLVGFKLTGPAGLTLVTTLPPTPSVEIDLASLTVQVPDIATSGNEVPGETKITSSGRDDFISLQADIDGIATLTGTGLPPLGLGFSLIDTPAFKLNAKLDLIDVDAGPVLGITQDFELVPTLMVDLAFDKEIQIAGMSGLQSSWSGIWDDLPDLALLETTTFTPTFWIDAMLTNGLGIDLGLVGTLDLFKLSATASAGPLELLGFGPLSLNNLLGFGNTLFDTDKFRISVYDLMFGLEGFNMVQGNPFTLAVNSFTSGDGGIFPPGGVVGGAGSGSSTSVPEPGTFWMLILGLALLGFVTRGSRPAMPMVCAH